MQTAEKYMDQPIAPQGERIVVAMSGGVDSSAAALLLADAGYDVVGVSMQVWDYRKNKGNAKKATCCAPADFEDAREVADHRGFPFYVFDFEGSFEDAVIKPFVNSYLDGYTPNPCLNCNRHVKFRELRRRAAAVGARYVATGHYARIRETAAGKFGLFTAVDLAKDQTYFLYGMTQGDLETTLFPVGGMPKDEVRALLAEHKLDVAQKAESQDICFVSGEVSEFIERFSGERPDDGAIVNESGEKLGTHRGVHNFTVGQRRGLGVSAESPLYVLSIDAEEKKVVVGNKDALAREGFRVGDVNWISGEVPTAPVRAMVKMRYRHAGVLCDIYPTDEPNFVRIEFVEEWSAVSPGQAAVFYRETFEPDGSCEVLGGGIIQKDNDE